MTRARLPSCIEVLRGWLQGELGDGANICHQRSVDPFAGADVTHRFTVSVRVADAVDLFRLRALAPAIARGERLAVTVIRIEPVGPIDSGSKIARRDFIIHARGDA